MLARLLACRNLNSVDFVEGRQIDPTVHQPGFAFVCFVWVNRQDMGDSTYAAYVYYCEIASRFATRAGGFHEPMVGVYCSAVWPWSQHSDKR